MRTYDEWKTTPPEDQGPPEGWYHCQVCARHGRGAGPDSGWFDGDELCGCCCEVCLELDCRCYEIPEACAAWHEDHGVRAYDFSS